MRRTLVSLSARVLCCAAICLSACGEGTPPPKPPKPIPRETLRNGTFRVLPPEPRSVTAPVPPGGPFYELDDSLRLNEIQMKGSHNSYHLRPRNNTDLQWQYDLPSLPDQLTKYGVRAVELDIHYVNGQFGVFHLAGTDPNSTCFLLTQCLAQIRDWSTANPGHQPLFIYLEIRDQEDPQKIINHLEELESVLVNSWPRERVLTPDDVTAGHYADVQSAIRDRGWPTLGQTRGKAIFVMYDFTQTSYEYAYEGNGLWGRRMFVTFTDTGWRHAGILAMDSAIEEEQQIKAAVAQGFIVRTRSDDLPDRGSDFWYKHSVALRSGAQMVLTDYPNPLYIPGYDTSIPGGTPSRCNPIAIPQTCGPLQIENPALLAQPKER